MQSAVTSVATIATGTTSAGRQRVTKARPRRHEGMDALRDARVCEASDAHGGDGCHRPQSVRLGCRC